MNGLDPRRFPPDQTDWMSGYLSWRPLDDGRALCLMPLTLGRLRIVIAEDMWTAGEHWCYPHGGNVDAVESFRAYPIPPFGWARHMRPDGSFEYPNEGDSGANMGDAGTEGSEHGRHRADQSRVDDQAPADPTVGSLAGDARGPG